MNALWTQGAMDPGSGRAPLWRGSGSGDPARGIGVHARRPAPTAGQRGSVLGCREREPQRLQTDAHRQQAAGFCADGPGRGIKLRTAGSARRHRGPSRYPCVARTRRASTAGMAAPLLAGAEVLVARLLRGFAGGSSYWSTASWRRGCRTWPLQGRRRRASGSALTVMAPAMAGGIDSVNHES